MSKMPKEAQSLVFQQSEPLVYQRKQVHILPMNRRDWNRIKLMAGRIKSPKRFFSTLGSISLGVFTSSIVAIVSIYKKRSECQDEFHSLMYVLIISLAITMICYLIAYFKKYEINTRGEELVSEMNSIEEDFVSPIDSTGGYYL